MEYWNKKAFCLITGASRGIGRCMAIEFAKKVAPGSVILLVARSRKGLEETKAEILKNSTSSVTVSLSAIDLGSPDGQQFQTTIKNALDQSGSQASDFEHAMIVQCAASLGIKSGLKVADMDDLADIHEYYSFNLYSFILLNAEFFKIFKQTEESKQLRSAVHISSLGAQEPFKTWGLYCASKAARDMLLKSMALESGIHTLNWAPGSVDTAIYEEAVNFTSDPELAKIFEEDRKAGKILTCEQTVTKLMRVLAGQKFIMGEHVSYNDID